MYTRTHYKALKSKDKNTLIIPIFTPFWACPQICVFCNQALQTGQKDESSLVSSEKLIYLLDQAREKVVEVNKDKIYKDIEIAFYGGTFSLLPEKDFNRALDFIKELKEKHLITKARCSTRPDACQENRLIAMKNAGIDTIELGIQSFSDVALDASNRGYKKDIAILACNEVKKHGFKLGIQLMPNMPAQQVEDFYNDIAKVLEIKPAFIRLYPCLVVNNTALARTWKENKHIVWEEQSMVEHLAFALYSMWQANIDVIRIGVAPEEEFYNNVLAGVWHNSLGQLVQIRAFKMLINNIIEEFSLKDKDIIWHLPFYTKGYIMLQQDNFWKEKGISATKIQWHEEKEIYFELV